MKKKIVSLLFVFFGFFFFSCFKVDAALLGNESLDFDIHEHFNYFYEMKTNSKFYQFVISKGDNFLNYLNSYSGYHDYVLFSYSSDLVNFSLPDNSYYSIILYKPNSNSTYSGISLLYSDDSYSFRSLDTYSYYILFYDYDMNYLGSIDEDNFSNHSFINSVFSNYSDITYIFGSLYFSSNRGVFWNSSTSSFDIRITSVHLDNQYYFLNDLETINGFSLFIIRIGNWFRGIENINLSDFGLSYLLKNYLIKEDSNFVTLYQAFNYSDNFFGSISVPEGYSSQSFSYNDRYYLIPINSNCSNVDSLLYFSTSDITSINFISYTLLKDVIDYSDISTYSFSLKRANNIEAFSLNSVLSSDSKITDNFYIISSSDNFSSNTFYYNSSCFMSYSAISNEDIIFENINTGNNVVITPAEQQFIIYNSNNKIDSVIETSVSNDVDIISIISGAWTGAKTFISASYYILSMVTNLFVVLPNEVSSILLCVFTLGMIIILWKVFRS